MKRFVATLAIAIVLAGSIAADTSPIEAEPNSAVGSTPTEVLVDEVAAFLAADPVATVPLASTDRQGLTASLAPTLQTAVAKKKTGKITSAELPGGTISLSGATRRTLAATVTPGERRWVELQVYDPKKKVWKVFTKAYTDSAGKAVLSIPPTSSELKWRLLTKETDRYVAAVSPITTVKRVSRSVVVQNTTLRKTQSSMKKADLTFTVPEAPAGTKVTLEKLVGTTWKLAKVQAVPASKQVAFQVDAAGRGVAKTSTAKYRLVVPGFAPGIKKTTGATFTLNLENPWKYTGEQRQMYDLVAVNCPGTLVRIDPGLFTAGYWGWTQRELGVINIATGIPLIHKRTVGFHECAHIRQQEMYGHKWQKFLDETNAVSGTSGTIGMERNAECIARSWGAASYVSYGSQCGGREGDAGAAIALRHPYFAR
ncbi:MAG: hypothetical protein JWQ43_2151 [Glaciihabitans sp.]|nr:hypothetical protein [Glaciihabitans sp.]